MRTIEFKDIHGVEVIVQHSSLATQEAYRIYMSGEGFEPDKDNMNNDIPRCLHLNKNQACILIAGLQDLMKESD